jgi:hypothetical protein
MAATGCLIDAIAARFRAIPYSRASMMDRVAEIVHDWPPLPHFPSAHGSR